MFSETLFTVERLIREEYEDNCRDLPSCGRCPLRKEGRCSHRGPAPKIKVPENFNGVLVLFAQTLPSEERNILNAALTATSTEPEETLFYDVTRAPLFVGDSNSEVSRVAVDCCRTFLYQSLRPLIGKIRVILPVGYEAFYALYGRRVPDGRTIAPAGRDAIDAAERWRGWRIPDGLLKAHVCPLLGHSSLKDGQEKSAARLIFVRDIHAAAQARRLPAPEQPDYESCLCYDKPLSFFRKIVDEKLMRLPPETLLAVDYETTGLKPHAQAHKIVSLSFCWEAGMAYAFKTDTPEARRLAADIMTSPHRKIAANMKFEEAWSRAKLRVKVRNWYWDTMLMAHILDNRDSISGVKFQSFVRLGLIDYNSHVKAALESAEDSNGVNNITSLGDLDLLKYCAMDSLVEYRIAQMQMMKFGERISELVRK